jgi:SOS-response transcriptional repressor LexA
VTHKDPWPNADDSDELEDVKDALVSLVGRRALQRLDPLDAAQAAFLEWEAREARLSLSASEEKRLNAGAERFVTHVLTRRAMERVRMGEIRSEPVSSPAHEHGTVAAAVAITARLRQMPECELSVAAGAGRELWDEPCDRWIALPDHIPDGRHLALRVSGDSMEPLLHSGDTILVRLGDELVPDSVVVARVPDGGYVVKRVGGIAGSRVELASLNPDYPTIVIPRDPSLVLGTVLLRWCTHGDRPRQ